MGYQVTRQVLDRDGNLQPARFTFGDEIAEPGIAIRLADMMKWDAEVRNGHHHPGGKKYTRQDYDLVTSLVNP